MQKFFYVLALGKTLGIVETDGVRPPLDQPDGRRAVIMAACLSRDEALRHVERRCAKNGYTYQS